MFSNLRNGSALYILHKLDIPTLEVSKVTSMQTSPAFGQIYNNIIDIQTESSNYPKIPANLDVVDYGDSILIASSKEAMSREILEMKQRSENIINSVEQHKNIIEGCSLIYKLLNPEIKEREEKEEALRKEINELKELFKKYIQNGSNN